MNNYEQAVLDLAGPVPATFATYHAGPNAAVVAILQAAASGHLVETDTNTALPWIYLSGEAGSGRTHLLLACCATAREQSRQALYFGLKRHNALQPALPDMENADLVAIDDIDAIAGDSAWEEGLFHFLNRARVSGATLVISATQPPENAGLQLPDLRSRLSWGQRQRLKPLNDDDLSQVLHLHANARGFPLSDKIIRYLLTHSTRNTTQLLQILDQLEQTTYASKRKPSLALAAEVVGLFKQNT